jgi:hypothetical protein
MAGLYTKLAQLYDTDEDDPRIYKLVQKITDKGIDPNQWIDTKIGTRQGPLERQSVDPRRDTSFKAGGGVRQKDVAAKDIRQGESLPPTEDERLGIDDGMAKPGIGTRALVGAATPEQRRQFLRGVSDTATFGLAEKAGNYFDKDFAKSAATDAEQAPDARDYGAIAGAVMPGATGTVGRIAGKGVGAIGALGARLGGAAGGGIGSMIGGGIGGAVGGAAAAPVVGGLVAGGQAAVKGPVEDGPEAALEGARATLHDPMAMLGGAALGAMGGVAQGIRRSDTRTGEDIRAVEEFGGKPSLLKGAKGGAFEDPRLKNRRGTTEDVGAVAREAGDDIRRGLNERTDAIQRRYGEGLERIRRDEFVAEPSRRRAVPSGRPEDTWEAATRVAENPNWKLEGQTSRPVEGPTTGPGPGAISTEPIRVAAEKLLQSERLSKAARAEIKAEVLDALAEKPTMGVEQLNEFRGKLQDLSKFGENTSKPHFKVLHRETKRLVDETDFGQVNAEYTEGIQAQQRAHRQLGLGKKTSRTDIEDPVAAKKVARVVRRQGENTATAGQEGIDVQRFLAENPEFTKQLAASRLMGAKGRLRFGLPEEGGLYDRLSGTAVRNIEPLLGSVAYPVGNAVGQTGAATAPTMIKLLEDAMAERRRRDEERARMLSP